MVMDPLAHLTSLVHHFEFKGLLFLSATMAVVFQTSLGLAGKVWRDAREPCTTWPNKLAAMTFDGDSGKALAAKVQGGGGETWLKGVLKFRRSSSVVAEKLQFIFNKACSLQKCRHLHYLMGCPEFLKRPLSKLPFSLRERSPMICLRKMIAAWTQPSR